MFEDLDVQRLENKKNSELKKSVGGDSNPSSESNTYDCKFLARPNHNMAGCSSYNHFEPQDLCLSTWCGATLTFGQA